MLGKLITLAFVGVSYAWTPALSSDILFPRHSRAAASRYRRVVQAWPHAPPAASNTHVYSPIEYGGDPTGQEDSTVAVQTAVAALLNASSAGIRDANGILDCGGATLDLQGGEFLVSSPIVLPAYYGNMRVTQGTLRASPTFPRDGYLIQTGLGGGADGNNIDVFFDELFLDAYQVAAGGIQAVGLFGGVIGPQIYVFNFTQTGINISSGHEVTVQQTWVGEYWWSDSRKENGNATTANGIVVIGNDHVISDVVVFSSKAGITIAGEADLISNVHTWNLATGNGGVGIVVNASQTRISGAYLDWNDLVVLTPTMVSITDGFYLCGGHIQLVAPASGIAEDVYISNNQYIADYCGFKGYSGVEAVGTFTSVRDVSVSGTLAQSMIGVLSTTVTKSVASNAPTTSFSADFTDALLFNVSTIPILSVQYSVEWDAPLFARHAARPSVNGIVTIETDTPVTGVVTITVDQALRRRP